MPVYSWRHKKTGEVVDVARTVKDVDVPPFTGDADDWERVITPFGIGRVEGGGASPGRSSVIKND